MEFETEAEAETARQSWDSREFCGNILKVEVSQIFPKCQHRKRSRSRSPVHKPHEDEPPSESKRQILEDFALSKGDDERAIDQFIDYGSEEEVKEDPHHEIIPEEPIEPVVEPAEIEEEEPKPTKKAKPKTEGSHNCLLYTSPSPRDS